MKKAILPFCLIAMLPVSCTIVREERMLKKSTAEWREAKAVLSAYADSPLAGSFLTLRENNRFERTGGSVLKSFEAGNWTISGDTIRLLYVDEQQQFLAEEKLYIDRSTSTLTKTPDTPVWMRLRIMATDL
jgi:hypothetical protein